MAFDFDNHTLCYTTDFGGVMAIRPRRIEIDGEILVGWAEPTHVRQFPVKRILKDEPNEFRFEDDVGRKFFLKPLTLDIWRKQIRKKFLDTAPDFKDETEFRQAFLNLTVY